MPQNWNRYHRRRPNRRTRAGRGWKSRPSPATIDVVPSPTNLTPGPDPPCASISITAAPDWTWNLPDDRVVGPLAIRPAAAAGRPAKRPSPTPCADPIGSPPLAELARGRKNACILICDITRPVPEPPASCRRSCAPWKSRASPARDILILIATGLHRPNEGAELVELVGPEIAAQLPHREPSRQGPRGARLPRRDAQRRAGLARLALRPGRPEDHDRPDRAAPDGRLQRRPQGHLPRHRRPGDGQGLARAEIPRTPQGRLRHRRGQPRPRGEHAHRPDGRLRLHRQRLPRRPAARHLGRRRRHDRGVGGGRALRGAGGQGAGAPSRWTWW